jgi:hypothetical protein
VLKRTVAALGVISIVMIVVFCEREPFDAMHQKRVFILHSEDVGRPVLRIAETKT